jgi:hypothetical protein
MLTPIAISVSASPRLKAATIATPKANAFI